MTLNLAGVIELPGFAGTLGRVLLVEADEQVDQLAADRPGAQQARQLGQLNQPLRWRPLLTSPGQAFSV
jgi:hypothetical protein